MFGRPSSTHPRQKVTGDAQPPRLVANGQRIVLTWRCSCRLAVVNVRTRKARWLGGDGRPVSADWSPDSRQLLVTDPSTAYLNCALLWRVGANGTKPQRIRNCS